METKSSTEYLATLEKIQALKHEVNDLHPLLNDLFQAMPGIIHVEYMHGTNEKGADFILHREDSALKQTTYIGVIVKAKPIMQNHDDVERQIKECGHPRLGIDGKMIRLNEIWIVSNQHIAQNARDKIYNNYEGSNISFVPGQRLAELVKELLPDKFTRIPPHLQNFAAELTAKIKTENARGALGDRNDGFYVEPELIPVEYETYRSTQPKARKAITLDELISSLDTLQCVMIEAPVGGGKSKLSREILRRLISSEKFESEKVLPMLVHAREFAADYSSSVENYVRRVYDDNNIQAATRAVLLIDGFDELDLDSEQRSSFLESIQTSCGAGTSKPIVILTTRPLEDSGELAPRLRTIAIVRIARLKGSRGLQLLARAAGNLELTSRIINDVRDSPLFIALEGSPIAFLLLGRLLAESSNDLPSNLTELFQKYTELVLGRWEIEKGLRVQKEYDVLNICLTQLATDMMLGGYNEASLSDFEKIINDYVRPRPIVIDAKKLIAQVTGRNGLLYTKSNQAIGFRHRVFCEFFYALSLSSSGPLAMSTKAFDPYWMNSFFFAVGMKRDAPEFLSAMGSFDVKKESDVIAKCMAVGQFLLAGYLTRRDVTQASLLAVFKEMAALYLRATGPGSGYKLAQFPPLQLLGALNLLMRHHYGYAHFKDELGECIYEVEADDLSNENAICLLFLDTAYRSAGGELRFDALLDRYGDGLALLVKLAIKHESMRMKEFSDRIHKMERNLRRALRSQKHGGTDAIKRLYKTPMRSINKPVI